MRSDTWQIVQAWAIAALVYPGLVFGIVLSLLGEWIYSAIRPSLIPRLYRVASRPKPLLAPLRSFLKLLGRVPSANPGFSGDTDRPPAGVSAIPHLLLVIAPVLALALLPFPGNPIYSEVGAAGDLLLVTVLLALGPVSLAVLRSVSGGLDALKGGRVIGRLATGLFPALISLAALIQVQGSTTTQLSLLNAAPETGIQFLVRLLAGAALLIALPWWAPTDTPIESAFAQAGAFLQRAALAGFWAAVVLPAPGDFTWAVVVYVGGALAAYVGMRVLAEKWAPALHPEEAARRVWFTSAPAALVAVLAALVWGS